MIETRNTVGTRKTELDAMKQNFSSRLYVVIDKRKHKPPFVLLSVCGLVYMEKLRDLIDITIINKR